MRLYKRISISAIVFLAIFFGCEKNKALNQAGRFVSNSLECDNADRCFDIVDSLSIISSLKNIFWEPLPLSDSLVSFHDYSDVGENATILVLHNVKVEEAGEYLIRLGSDDGFRLFLNGEEAGRKVGGRAVQPDNDWVKIELEQGINQLVFQVNQGTGGWGLYYAIEPFKGSNFLIENFISEIYRDLPLSTILPDTIQTVQLKQDSKQSFDTQNRLRFRWRNLKGTIKSEWVSFLANIAPTQIKLPENFDGFKLLEYELISSKDSLLYKEVIPIYHESKLKNKVTSFYSRIQNEPKFVPYRKGLEIHHPWIINKETESRYSTRHKAEFLIDIEQLLEENLNYIGGPRTIVHSQHLYRTYLPYTNRDKLTEAVIGLHVELEDSVNHYFRTYAGQSHSKMVEWNSYSQVSGKPLLFPYINQTERSHNINDYFKGLFVEHQKKYQSLSVMTWSKGVPLLLNELTKQEINIEQTYLVSSWLLPEKTEAFVIGNRIASNNSSVIFTFVHGQEDTDIPYTDVKIWQEQLEKNNLNTSSIIIPYSSHWTYWRSPEKLLIVN